MVVASDLAAAPPFVPSARADVTSPPALPAGAPLAQPVTPTPAPTPTAVVPLRVVGTGTAASCTEAAFDAALVGGGAITFNCGPAPVTITFTGGITTSKVIANNTRIDGGGRITLSGGNAMRPFQVLAGQRLVLQNLVVANGNAAGGDGGAILNQGDTTLTNVVVANSTASSGGGIANLGALSLAGSTISGNTGLGGGGGIYNASTGTLAAGNSTISGNSAGPVFFDPGRFGGGIKNEGNGRAALKNVTISGNRAADDGGGLYNNDNNLLGSTNGVDLENVTITDNQTLSDAGGFDNFGVIAMKNTLVAGNRAAASSPDCRNVFGHPITSQGYNLVGNTVGCNVTGDSTGNQLAVLGTVIDPKLGPLQSNGGPTLTHMPRPGSPAIDAGNPAAPGSGGNACAGIDQRNVTRAIDGAGNGSALCDIGAVEADPPRPALPDLGNHTLPSALRIAGNGTTMTDGIRAPGVDNWYAVSIQPGARIVVTVDNLPIDVRVSLYSDPRPDPNAPPLSAFEFGSLMSARGNHPGNAPGRGLDRAPGDGLGNAPGDGLGNAPGDGLGNAPGDGLGNAPGDGLGNAPGDGLGNAPGDGLGNAPGASQRALAGMVGYNNLPGTGRKVVDKLTLLSSGDYFIRVQGANGASDAYNGYQIKAEVSGGIACPAPALPAAPSKVFPAAPAGSGGYRTLVLTNYARLASRFGIADTAALSATVQSRYAASPLVAPAYVLDLGDPNDPALAAVREAYRFLDDTTPPGGAGAPNATSPCAVDAVARSIRNLVLQFWGQNAATLEFQLIVGGTGIVPTAYVPDVGAIANERLYDAEVNDGSIVQTGFLNGLVPTYDCYASRRILQRSGRAFCKPDLAQGVLVERPSDIMRMLDDFLNTPGGTKNVTSAASAGHTFMRDVAEVYAARIEARGVPTYRQIGETWSAADHIAQFFNTRRDVAFTGAHGTVRREWAPAYDSSYSAQDVLDAPLANLLGTLRIDLACHAGRDIPDPDAPLGLGLDFAQAYNARGASFVGGTTYMYGSDVIAFHEDLLALFLNQLLNAPGSAVGGPFDAHPRTGASALTYAKNLLLLSAAPASFDGLYEKVTQSTVFYGVPQLKWNFNGTATTIPSAGTSTGAAVTRSTPAQPGPVGAGLTPFAAGVQLQTLSLTPNVAPMTVYSGTQPIGTVYAAGGGEVQVVDRGPVLPRVTLPDALTGAFTRAMFRGGTYHDVQGYDPFVTYALTETPIGQAPFFSQSWITPGLLAVNQQLLDEQVVKRLVVTPAQLKPTTGFTGTLRLYDTLEYDLIHADVSTPAATAAALDLPLSIVSADGFINGSSIRFRARLSGATGVALARVTYTSDRAPLYGRWQSLDLQPDPTSPGEWVNELTVAEPEAVYFFVQAAAPNGSVVTVNNDGNYLRARPATLPQMQTSQLTLSPGTPIPAGGVQFGTLMSLTAQLTAAPAGGTAAGVAGKPVTFTLGDQSAVGFTDSTGTVRANLRVLQAPGSHTASVAFTGDETYTAATSPSVSLTVAPMPTALSLPAGPAIALDDPRTGALAATLLTRPASPPAVPLTDRGVTFNFVDPVRGTPVLSANGQTNHAGVAQLPMPPGLFSPLFQGTYQLTAQFAGTAGYQASTAPAAPQTLAITFTDRYRYQLMALQLASIRSSVQASSVDSAARTGLLAALDAAEQARAAAAAVTGSQLPGSQLDLLAKALADATALSRGIVTAGAAGSGDASLWIAQLTTVNQVVDAIDRPPTASAGGPYTVAEGGSVTLAGSGSDPDTGDSVATYSWDLTGGSSFTTSGQSPAFSAAGRDGPATQTVAIKACDSRGRCGTSTATVSITNAAPSVGTITAPAEAKAVNTPVSVSAPFTDPGTPDTHTGSWEWGDGTTSPGTVTEANGAGTSAGTHSYSRTGLFTLKLTVADDDGGSAQSSHRYVVVYDPNGGFLTGGGWINSPAGAYAPNPGLAGKLHLNLDATYTPGATAPTGETELRVESGELNLRSQSYDWLVISGGRAYLSGTGTSNGTGSYGFLVTVIDGKVAGGSDRVRIKVWDRNRGNRVVYDSQTGAADDADPTTPLGGGSVVIHR